MKIKALLLVFIGALAFQACGPKPQYKTAEGKRKIKRYNAIQYEEPRP